MGRGTVRSVAFGLAALGWLLGTWQRPGLALAGQASFAQTLSRDNAENREAATAEVCDLRAAVPTATVTLGEIGVVPACVVVSAGDLVTWVNATSTEISIHTADDQLASGDLSATFCIVDIPAQGEAAVRLIHAGRVAYSAPENPVISGTILVLGRGAA